MTCNRLQGIFQKCEDSELLLQYEPRHPKQQTDCETIAASPNAGEAKDD